MSERGVFAVDRGIWDHPFFANERHTEREAWEWLISEASFKPRARNISGKVVRLERGQLAASVRFMAERWQWSKSRVDRFLKRLKIETMIGTDAGTGILIITINNYNKFQRVSLPDRDADQDSERDTRGTAAGQQRDKREDIEDIEDIETSSLRSEGATPPKPVSKRGRAKPRTALPDIWQLDQQDMAHAIDCGLAVDRIRLMAPAFADHHRSKATLSADWHASWRTWCRNEIKFHGDKNSGYRTGNTRQTGHDAILAVAARKARELDRNDDMGGPADAPGFAFRHGTDRVGSEGHHDQASGNGSGNQRDEPDNKRIREGEIIPPDKNAAGLPGSWQCF